MTIEPKLISSLVKIEELVKIIRSKLKRQFLLRKTCFFKAVYKILGEELLEKKPMAELPQKCQDDLKK